MHLSTAMRFMGVLLVLLMINGINCQDASDEESGRKQQDEERQAAQKLQEEIETAHANDPKDPLQLASRTLERAFDRFNDGKKEISGFKLMSTLNRAAGEPRLLLIRIFELMDKNMDGRISNEEFTSLYMAPVAYPDRAIELMFKLHDLDKNGYISQWEYLRHSLTIDGINQNVQDKWIEAGQKIKQQDVNGDGLVDLTEFTLFVVWQVNVGIARQKEKGNKFDKNQVFHKK
ncbi:Calmodulin [Orchesella cincta]|uniref:Calmodulin n=1 Tax=Orchesella cincta TaxID=48709 RepID=A0A1D2NEC6_ORCCI|nr:Calmodulin [Orchesella cincta]